MTEESRLRKNTWMDHGCNMLDVSRPKSTPIAFWTEFDIWEYIKTRNLSYADIYDEGAKRTGCTFCMFGYWSKNDHGTENDRMELLKRVEPKKYEYCMKDIEDGGLGLRKIIDYIDLKLKNIIMRNKIFLAISLLISIAYISLTAWSRIKLNCHTWPQCIVGITLGLVITILISFLLYYTTKSFEVTYFKT